METKNPMADAIESQAKAVSNIVETSKKLQDSFLKGEMFEKGPDIYKDWLDKQKHIIEETLGGGTAAPKPAPEATSQTTSTSTDVFQEWAKMQANFLKAWMDTMQQAVPKAPVPGPEAFFQETKKMYDVWSGMYQQWLSQLGNGFGDIRSFMGGSMGQNPVGDMLNAAQAYMKMYEVWQPIMQTMQAHMKKFTEAGSDTKFDFSSFAQAFSPDKYKQVLDSVFRFMPSEQMKAFYEQINKLMQQSFDMGKGAQEQYSSYLKQFATSFTPPNWDSFNMANNPFVRQIEQIMAPIQKLMPMGKEKESLEAARKLQEKYVAYWQRTAEMQYMIYSAGQKSLEKMLEEVMEKARRGDTAAAMNYTEFFNQWLNTTESIMIDTFGTDEFSRIQGEVLTLGMEIKRLLEQQMEVQLAAYPVVTRSEADELIETIHELRTRIRKLEKAVGKAKPDDREEVKGAGKKAAKNKV